MTKLWKWVMVGAAMMVPCMALELPEPPYSMWVEVVADDVPPRSAGTDEVRVRVSAARLNKRPAICSLDLSCSAFDGTTKRISMNEVGLLREASEAAKAGMPFKREFVPELRDGSMGSMIESVLREGRWVVMMTCGELEATFDLEESERLDRVLIEGRAAERWYRALFVKGVKPDETPEIHPPFSEGMTFMGRIGKAAGKGLEFDVILRIFPDARNSRISWSLGADKQGVGGDWAAEIPGRISEALAAIRAGKPYLFENEHYSVLGNRDAKEAEIALDKGLRGAFDEANLADIEKLKAAGEARMLWFQQNERLFFKEIKKAR